MQIRYRRGKPWEFVALAAALGTVLFPVRQDSRPLSEWLALLAMCFLVLGAFSCMAWRGRFDRRVVVAICEEGIWYRGWHISRPLPWSEIRAARFQMAPKGESWICLQLHDEARLLQDPAYASAARRTRVARLVNATTFSLRATLLEVSNQQMMSLIQERLLASAKQ